MALRDELERDEPATTTNQRGDEPVGEAAAEREHPTVLQSLDLSASTFLVPKKVRAEGRETEDLATPAQWVDSYKDSKLRTLQRVLCEVDLGGLCWLQSLSVRGCGSLRVLLIPPGLTALDASGSSQLRTLQYGVNHSVEHAGLQVLNLNGCRELCHMGVLARLGSLARCSELDLSFCRRLPGSVVASALSSAGSLASLSLRGVATDGMLHSLAAAVGTNLRLADCAFSKDITDAGVNALVQGAPRLQRMNLRGCDSISAECYNITPITLLERSRAQSADGASGAAAAAAPAAAAEAASPAKMRRKGDNMFWFGRQ